jgi:hypothetical protein
LCGQYLKTVFFSSLIGLRVNGKKNCRNFRALRKIIEVFKSGSIRATQRDADMLLLNIKGKKICSKFVVRAIRDVSSRNFARRQANHDRSAKPDLDQVLTKAKKMKDIDDNIY